MNWIGIISICVTVTLFVGGGLLKAIFDIRRELGAIQTEQQRVMGAVAEKYVQSRDFSEFKVLMRQELTAVRQEIAAVQQTLTQALGLLHELKGAQQGPNRS